MTGIFRHLEKRRWLPWLYFEPEGKCPLPSGGAQSPVIRSAMILSSLFTLIIIVILLGKELTNPCRLPQRAAVSKELEPKNTGELCLIRSMHTAWKGSSRGLQVLPESQRPNTTHWPCGLREALLTTCGPTEVPRAGPLFPRLCGFLSILSPSGDVGSLGRVKCLLSLCPLPQWPAE